VTGQRSDSQDGINQLILACSNGDIASAKALINSGIPLDKCGRALDDDQGETMSVFDQFLIEGRTPLTAAVGKGEIDTVRFLLDAGAAIDQRDCNGSLPVHAAAALANTDCLELLIDRGADLDALTEPDGMTPLMVAARWNSPCVDFLAQRVSPVKTLNSNGVTALMVVAEAGEDAAVVELLRRGADVNATMKNGITPLIAAASGTFNESVLRALSEAGADLEARASPDGFTALMVAYFEVHDAREKMAVLLECGADPNARDWQGRSVLQIQRLRKEYETEIRALLESYGFSES
jgi:ankyrin repeat protein